MRTLLPLHWMIAPPPRRNEQEGAEGAEGGNGIPRSMEMQTHQDAIAEWQAKTFPTQPLAGKLAHLKQEVEELGEHPDEVEEWADVLNLFLGSAAMAGLDVRDLLMAGALKLEVCRQRKWGPVQPDGSYHHVEDPTGTSGPRPQEGL